VSHIILYYHRRRRRPQVVPFKKYNIIIVIVICINIIRISTVHRKVRTHDEHDGHVVVLISRRCRRRRLSIDRRELIVLPVTRKLYTSTR